MAQPVPGRISLTRSAARRDQLVAAAVALLFLAGALALRPVLVTRRADIVRSPVGAESSLRQLTIELPRLMLGGFRGLLAMILWQEAEEAKNNHQWQRLETTYDYIAVLQPYIVTVYTFHAWNQAYNLSAQWHEDENKYKWVLDGLSYLYNGEKYNPSSPDIQYEEANMYFLKIGGAFERQFYRQQWRADLARLHELQEIDKDSEPPYTAALRHVGDVAAREEFKLTLLEAPDKKGPKGWGVRLNDLEALDAKDRTLDRYYGVSPFYFAYRAFDRVVVNNRRPSISSMKVIDAEPAMSLRLWCRDDIYYADTRIAELAKAWDDYQDDEKDRAKFSEFCQKERKTDTYKPRFKELADCYENVRIVAPMAVKRFQRHLNLYPDNKTTHLKHIMETQYLEALGEAEHALLQSLELLLEAGEMTRQSSAGFEETKAKYEKARAKFDRWMCVVFPGQGFAWDAVDWMNLDALPLLPMNEKMNHDYGLDFKKYREAIEARIAGIDKLREINGPAGKYDLGFLKEPASFALEK